MQSASKRHLAGAGFLVLAALVAGCGEGEGEAYAPPGPFNADCTTTRWADVSDECWSCVCDACASEVNACDETCTSVVECALENECMVEQASNLECEANCVGQECVGTDPDLQAAAEGPLTDFDLCLIEQGGGFAAVLERACAAECEIHPQDAEVCEAYGGN